MIFWRRLALLSCAIICLHVTAAYAAHNRAIRLECNGGGKTIVVTDNIVTPDEPITVLKGETRNYPMKITKIIGGTTNVVLSQRPYTAGLSGRLTFHPIAKNAAVISGSVTCSNFIVPPSTLLTERPVRSATFKNLSIKIFYGKEVAQHLGRYTLHILVK